MDWMESQHLAPDHAVRIDLISKLKGIQMAEEYFQSLPDLSKNHQTHGALLSCYCSKKLGEKAVAIFEKMKELGLVTGALEYNNLMTLHMKSGQAHEVERMFDEMKASNTLPDKCSYKILLESYALQNDIDSIERIVQGIEQNEGAWDWSVYCHLAAIYNSAKLFEKSRVSLKKAELVMNGRDTSPFPFLLSLYAGAGDLLEVKRVWGLLKARIHGTRPPTNKEYLALLQALKRFDDIDAMRDFFKEWELNLVSYDQKLMNAMIEAYLEKNMVEEARLLLETTAGEGIPPVLKSFWLFIHYYSRTGERDRAREWSSEASSFVKRGFKWECLERCLGRL
ncbi:Pentatricopeptide repeat-containing protein [Platanthera guangdongensis]|uniref:Pentatricopeptide repeat-containing protein n=1 Tax=Platanthera guangdongensis TaxID=2320717 RepID=A0ABR2LET6_9ASPA